MLYHGCLKTHSSLILCRPITPPQHYDKLSAEASSSGCDKAAATSEDPSASAAATAAAGSGGGSKDISALLAEEVAGLKDRKQQRFKTHNVDVKGCTFIIFPDTPGKASNCQIDLIGGDSLIGPARGGLPEGGLLRAWRVGQGPP